MELNTDMDAEEKCTISHFSEYEKVKRNIISITNWKEDSGITLIDLNKISEKTVKMLEPYKEQPNLLDPYLKELINYIVEVIKPSVHLLNYTPVSKIEIKDDQLFKYHDILLSLIYDFTRIRGFKIIANLFTHEVNDLEPFFYYFTVRQKHNLPWQSKHILLLWLGTICIMPFNLERVDSGFSSKVGYKNLIDHIISVCRDLLSSSGKPSESSGRLLAKVIIRQECITSYLPEFMNWAQNTLLNQKDTFLCIGILHTLVNIIKATSRDELLNFVDLFLSCLRSLDRNPNLSNNAILRKLRIKLAQRLGLIYLKPRLASWRYIRGVRVLGTNITMNEVQTHGNIKEDKDIESEDFEVPEDVEEIIDILMTGLKDKEVGIRWSSAKGIGRLTQRLPKVFGLEIAEHLLEMFRENVIGYDTPNPDFTSINEIQWHGLCLVIAELARRGLLVKDILYKVLRAALFALFIDLRRGAHSVGSNVRDSACYVLWSFARAYSKEDFYEISDELSTKLIIASLFDREGNVRRASSAAFQEFVGRVQLFPDGISVMTIADYFSVANLKNSFLKTSIKVAKFDHYRSSMFEHLYKVSSFHWDINIHHLAGEALKFITPLMDNDQINKAILFLQEKISKSDSNLIHGSLIALSNITYGTKSKISIIESLNAPLFPDLSNSCSIMSIPSVLNQFITRKMNGFGSELIFEAVLYFITTLSKCRFPLDELCVTTFKELLWATVNRKEEKIQELTAEAMKWFSLGYKEFDFGIEFYLNELERTTTLHTKKGICLILGSFNTEGSPKLSKSIINNLIKIIYDQGLTNSKEIDLKKNSIISLTEIMKSESFKTHSELEKESLNEIFICLIQNLKDYTIDSHGDVGSLVRKQSMLGLEQFSILISKPNFTSYKLTTEQLVLLCSSLLKQSCEKIDRIRQIAANILLKVIECFQVPFSAELKEIIESVNDWLLPAEVFPKMVKMLEFDLYRRAVLEGLLLSGGSITESLIKYAGGALLDYLMQLDQSSNTLLQISIDFVEILKDNINDERIIFHTLEVLNSLLDAKIFEPFINTSKSNEFGLGLPEIVKHFAKNPKNINLVFCKIICHFAITSIPNSFKLTWALILRFLTNPSLKVRTTTCDQLYMVISSSEPSTIPDPNFYNDLEYLLLNGNWSSSLKELREMVSPFYERLGLDLPKLKKR